MHPVKLIIFQLAFILATMQLLISALFTYGALNLNPVFTYIAKLGLFIGTAIPIIYLLIIRPYIRVNNKLLQRIQYHNPLTQLGNRRTLYDNLTHLVSYNARHRIYGAILLIDLEKLNFIYDRFGKEAIQHILTITAKRLISAVRKEDIVCHTGEHEFYVLLTNLTFNKIFGQRTALLTAKRIMTSLKKPSHFQKHQLEIEAYISIKIIPPEISSIRGIMHDLDTAMYNAKRGSTNQISLFDEQHSGFKMDY